MGGGQWTSSCGQAPVLMARLDIYRMKSSGTLVVDCQAELLEDLRTRIVIPLFPLADAPKPARNLNPVFELDDEQFVLMTQLLSAVESRELGKKQGSLDGNESEVMNALDFLLTGV